MPWHRTSTYFYKQESNKNHIFPQLQAVFFPVLHPPPCFCCALPFFCFFFPFNYTQNPDTSVEDGVAQQDIWAGTRPRKWYIIPTRTALALECPAFWASMGYRNMSWVWCCAVVIRNVKPGRSLRDWQIMFPTWQHTESPEELYKNTDSRVPPRIYWLKDPKGDLRICNFKRLFKVACRPVIENDW